MSKKASVIYYSKRIAVQDLLLLVPFELFTLYLIFYLDVVYTGLFMLALFSSLLFLTIRRLLDKSPQLIISMEGIQTSKMQLVVWEDICNERVVSKIGMRGVMLYSLVYEHPNGTEEYLVNGLELKSAEIGVLLLIYRGLYERSKKKQKS